MHTRLLMHTCIHNLLGETSVTVLQQSAQAWFKQNFSNPSPLSASLLSLAEGSASPNGLLSLGCPTATSKDTGLSLQAGLGWKTKGKLFSAKNVTFNITMLI